MSAAASKKQEEFDAWLKKLDGRRYVYHESPANDLILDIKGTVAVFGNLNTDTRYLPPNMSPYSKYGEFEIRSRKFASNSDDRVDVSNTISEDGQSITQRWRFFSDGEIREKIYRLKK